MGVGSSQVIKQEETKKYPKKKSHTHTQSFQNHTRRSTKEAAD
jgi:hypothetical protein